MGDLFTGMGMTEEAAGALAMKATELSYDLASFNNVSDARASEAMTKAMLGEFESMKALGVQFSVNTINESDYAKAIGKTWEQMSRAERAEAVYQEALKQSPNAIGDAERSAMSYTNQMKRLQARTLEVYETIGKYLLPIFTPIITKMGDMAEKVRDVITTFGKLYAETGNLKEAFTGTFGTADEIIANFSNVIGQMGEKMLAALPQVMSVVGNIASTLMDGLIVILPQLLSIGMQMITQVANGLTQAMPQIFAKAMELIQGLVNSLIANGPALIVAGLNMVMSVLAGIVQSLPQLVMMGLQLVLMLAQGLVQALPQLISKGVEAIVNFIRGIKENFPQMLSTAMEIIKTLATGIGQALPQLILAGIQIIFELGAAILQNLPQILTIGWQIIVALVEGIFNGLGQFLGSVAEKVSGWFKSIFGKGDDKEKVKKEGKDTSKAMADGVKERIDENKSSVEDKTKELSTSVESGLNTVGDKGAAAGNQAGIDTTNALTNSMGGMSNGVDAGFNEASKAVQQGATNMYNGAKQSFTKLEQVGKQAGTNLYNGVKVSMVKLEQAVKQSCSNIYNQGGNKIGRAHV